MQVKGTDGSTGSGSNKGATKTTVAAQTKNGSNAAPTSNSLAISNSTGNAADYLRGTTVANTAPKNDGTGVVTNPQTRTSSSSGPGGSSGVVTTPTVSVSTGSSSSSGGSSGSNTNSQYESLISSLKDQISANQMSYADAIAKLTERLEANDSAYASSLAQLNEKLSTQDANYQNIVNGLTAKLTNSEDSLKKITEAYNTALEQQKAAIQAGVDQSVNTINNQKSNVVNSYADTMRQLYLDKMNAQKNIGQQMAAAGQTGGQAESTLLGLNTNYADSLRQSEQAKSSTLSDLETAIANAKLAASAEEANAIANNATNSVNAYNTQLNAINSQGLSLASLLNGARNDEISNYMNYANLVNSGNQNSFNNAASIANLNIDSGNNAYNQSLNLADYLSGRSDTAYSNAYSKAMTWLQNGIMPDEQTLSEAGISQNEANSLISSINSAKTTKSSSGGSSGGSYKKATSDLNATQAKTLVNYAKNGGELTTEQIEALTNYSGLPIETYLLANDVDPTKALAHLNTQTKGTGLVQETLPSQVETSSSTQGKSYLDNGVYNKALNAGDVYFGTLSLIKNGKITEADQYLKEQLSEDNITDASEINIRKSLGLDALLKTKAK